jgi:DNA-binding CsgD family transcriptional regulator
MNRTGIIVAMESYMLRKGVISVLNRVPGVAVIREFDSAPPLGKFMQTLNRDLLVISQSILDKSPQLLLNNKDLPDRTLIMTYGHGVEPGNGILAIDVDDTREEILNKIFSLLESQPKGSGVPEISQLSPREKTIVRLVSLGYTNKQIAQELFLSAHTVITHRKNIVYKLGIKSVSGLTVYAIVNNIITIEEVNSKPV